MAEHPANVKVDLQQRRGLVALADPDLTLGSLLVREIRASGLFELRQRIAALLYQPRNDVALVGIGELAARFGALVDKPRKCRAQRVEAKLIASPHCVLEVRGDSVLERSHVLRSG